MPNNQKANRAFFIDDEPAFLELYSTKFKSAGFEVQTCSEPASAIEEAIQFKPDIIFLDLVMANVDGIGLLKKFKTNTETQWIPIIMLSNINNEADRKECEQEGASQFLIKSSFTPGELLDYGKKVLAMI